MKKFLRGLVKLFLFLVILLLFFSLTLYFATIRNYLPFGEYNLNFFTLTYSSNFFEFYSTYLIYFTSFLTFIVIFLVVTLFISRKREVHVKKVLEIKRNSSQKGTTDLDLLYAILKEKKVIPLSTIVNTFEVSNEVVFEWGKILEGGGLARIEYPHFKETQLVLDDENDKKKD